MNIDLISLVEIQLNLLITPYSYLYRDILFKNIKVVAVSHNNANKPTRIRQYRRVNAVVIGTLSKSIITIDLDSTGLGY